VIRDLQLEVLLRRHMCPTVEDSVLMNHPLHHMRCEGDLLYVRIQVCMLLNDDTAGVVLQVEQVPHVLGHLRPTRAELKTCDVAHGLEALSPLRIFLIADQKEHDRRYR
jgi:hypothetical protein